MSPALKFAVCTLSLQVAPPPLLIVQVIGVATPLSMTVKIRSPPAVLLADRLTVRALAVPAMAAVSLQVAASMADAEAGLPALSSVGVHAPETESYQ